MREGRRMISRSADCNSCVHNTHDNPVCHRCAYSSSGRTRYLAGRRIVTTQAVQGACTACEHCLAVSTCQWVRGNA